LSKLDIQFTVTCSVSMTAPTEIAKTIVTAEMQKYKV